MGYYDNLINKRNTLLGKGIKLPLSLDVKKGNDISIVEGLDTINQSIYMILSTRVGERFFVPEFGTNLYKYLFEPNISTVHDLVAMEVTDSLNKWEPRITNIRVTCESDESHLLVNVRYVVRNTSTVGNYVFPVNLDSYRLE